MASSSIIKNSINGTIKFEDGSTTSLTLSFDRGDFALNGLSDTLNEIVVVDTRGKYKGLMYGARKYPTFSFSAFVTAVGSTDDQDIIAFIGRKGQYASNVNVAGTGRPSTVKITIKDEATNFGEASDCNTVLPVCVIDDISYSQALEGNTLTFSGRVVGTGLTVNGNSYSETA